MFSRRTAPDIVCSVWGTWDVWIAGASPCRQDKLVGGDEPLLPLLVDAAQRVLVHKLRILIQIVDRLLAEGDAVAPIEAADMVLDLLDHLLPVVSVLLLAGLPAEGLGVLQPLPEQGGLVHQLLGDAAHVHAGPAQAPRGAFRRGLYKVAHGHFLAQAAININKIK